MAGSPGVACPTEVTNSHVRQRLEPGVRTILALHAATPRCPPRIDPLRRLQALKGSSRTANGCVYKPLDTLHLLYGVARMKLPLRKLRIAREIDDLEPLSAEFSKAPFIAFADYAVNDVRSAIGG